MVESSSRRRRRKRSNNNANIPMDVQFQILLCLPVASLLRFKSVCKSWYSHIQTSAFITQHLSQHHHQNDRLLVWNPCYSYKKPSSKYQVPQNPVRSFFILSGHNYQVAQNFDFTQCRDEFMEIVSSQNGLICLHYTSCQDICLWNPATNQLRVLPNSPAKLPTDKYDITVGFLFCAKTNDHMVLRFAFRKAFDLLKKQIEVYDLRNDSWRYVECDLPINCILSSAETPYKDEIYCWLGRTQYECYTILTYDVNNEIFATMSLPDDHFKYLYAPTFSLKVAILWENIACIHFRSHPSETENWHLDIWVLNEFGVRDSWTELYKIQLGSGVQSWVLPVGFLKDEIVLITDDKHCLCEPSQCSCGTSAKEAKMFLYHPVTEEIIFLPVQSPWSSWRVFQYKESLVSVNSVNDAAKSMGSVASAPKIRATKRMKKLASKAEEKK